MAESVSPSDTSANTSASRTVSPLGWLTVLDRGPRGGDTAANNTWSAGSLRPGESRLMTWRLVATKAGTYTVTYRVSPGLTGKAGVAAGSRAGGRFRVVIADRPVPARVGPGGTVIRGGSDESD